MSMTSALVVNPKSEAPKLVIQQYGTFRLEPLTDRLMNVKSESGILIDQVLYPFSGRMLKHQEGWYFQAESLVTPKLSPKKKTEALEKVTFHINQFMEQHPELLKVLELQAWERKIKGIDQEIQRAEQSLTYQRNNLASITELVATYEREIAELQQRRAEVMGQRPDDSEEVHEPETTEATVISGEVIPV